MERGRGAHVPYSGETRSRSPSLTPQQVDRNYWLLRDARDLERALLAVLRQHGAAAEGAVVQLLQSWVNERERVSGDRIEDALAGRFPLGSDESLEYARAIAPTLESVRFRGACDLALILGHLVDSKIATEDEVKGELKRIDFVKSDARNKLRAEKRK